MNPENMMHKKARGNAAFS